MKLLSRRFNRWLWTNIINSNGYHSYKVFPTPFGTFWLLRWGYWGGGFYQFFSLGKFFIRFRRRTKI